MRSVPSELHTIVSKDTNYEYPHRQPAARASGGGTTRGIALVTTTTQINLNQWHHVAVTYRSGAQRIYIDGVAQRHCGQARARWRQNNLPFYIGTDWNYISRAFDGYIDEVRILPPR